MRSFETWLGEPFSGHLTGLSSVDVRSIGARGSRGRLDPVDDFEVVAQGLGFEHGQLDD